MTKNFSQLRSRMSPDAQARSEAKAKIMLEELPLNELRQARVEFATKDVGRLASRSIVSHRQDRKKS